MELTHFGHSCLLAEFGVARLLFDPGTFSHGFEGITGLSAILITHQHPDHADPQRLPALVEANPEFKNNIALCSPPTPGNSYLRSSDGERFEGSFHLLTDPERRYVFNVDIIDVPNDVLRATYKPI